MPLKNPSIATACTRRSALSQALSSAWVLCCTGQAWAQASYPDKPLRVIVPQPPGGGFDFVSRVLAERLGKLLGQSVVVENRPGSGTLVGTDLAAKAAPDGYTLLTGSVSNLALNMGLYRNLPYDSLRDFEPLGLAVSYSYSLMARKDLAQQSLKDVIAFAKANPGKLTYASAGNGSGQHVLAAALWHLAGVELTHVPYRGAQPAYQDLLGGRVDVFFDLSSTARVHIDAGTVRPLAVSGNARLANHRANRGGAVGAGIVVWFLRPRTHTARHFGAAAQRDGAGSRHARGDRHLSQGRRQTPGDVRCRDPHAGAARC